MGDKSKIEWTDATWNPIRGCSMAPGSETGGCLNCYAAREALRHSNHGGAYEGLVRITGNGPRWTGKVRSVDDHLLDPFHWRKPRRIFVNSMSDLFHENLSVDVTDKIFAVMALSHWHIHQFLTKRAVRVRNYMRDPDTRRRVALAMLDLVKERSDDGPIALEHRPDSSEEEPLFCSVWPLPNVWVGVSVEDQETADGRIPLLMETPAAVRWVSYEPALGAVSFQPWLTVTRERQHMLDWIVCGGESGPGARPIDPAWARLVRDQCQAAGVPFFFKQWGEWMPSNQMDPTHPVPHAPFRKLDFSDGGAYRVGKKVAGDLLDGKQWHEYPR